MRQIIGVSADLVVEGVDPAPGGRRFHGRVIALAVDAGADEGPPDPAGTWLLVADDEQPRPIWVAQRDVTGQRLGR
ncbi:MAG TPA: hypothetical protein VLB47_15830 [Solirubrobacteraceae bacterium]|nr:hypothetical protein [Solirubrobacteraceae bacterium]